MAMTVLWWLLPAVLVFWAVGAYNRLTRLRGEALRSYGALHAVMVRQSELLQSALPADPAQAPQGPPTMAGELMDATALAWRGLRAGLLQFNALLVATRNRALEPEALAALATARGVLATAWNRVQNDGHDLAGAPVPYAVISRWDDLMRDAEAARSQFNESVQTYNAAVRQFPAVLLAVCVGLRPARTLDAP